MPAKISVRPRKNTAEGGCGGNSAVFLQKIEASPAALLVQSRTQQKSFLFLLEEKIRRAHIRKSEENFFAGWRVSASGGGLASLVWFRSRISDKISSSQTVKTHHNFATVHILIHCRYYFARLLLCRLSSMILCSTKSAPVSKLCLEVG